MTDTPDPADITIVLADDHAVVRSGLRLLLDQAAASTSSPRPATPKRAAQRPRPQADRPHPRPQHARPTRPRSTRSREIADVSPGTRVVVLTMQEDPEFARQALRAGAAGYVLKEAADSELVEAVRRAAAGETYLNPRLGAALAAAARPDRPARRPVHARSRSPAARRARATPTPKSPPSSTSPYAPSNPTAPTSNKNCDSPPAPNSSATPSNTTSSKPPTNHHHPHPPAPRAPPRRRARRAPRRRGTSAALPRYRPVERGAVGRRATAPGGRRPGRGGSCRRRRRRRRGCALRPRGRPGRARGGRGCGRGSRARSARPAPRCARRGGRLGGPVDAALRPVRVGPGGVLAGRRARRVGDGLLAEQQERALGQAVARLRAIAASELVLAAADVDGPGAARRPASPTGSGRRAPSRP